MRGYMKELKKRRGVAFAGTSGEGVGIVRLHRKVPLFKIVSAAHSLGLALSDERHPERRKYLDVRAKSGEIVATIVDSSLLLLPKHAKTRLAAIDFANALLH